MRRWRYPLIIVLVLVAVFSVACHERKVHAQAKRTAEYQLSLKSYSEALPLESTRKAVEDYFRGHNTQFRQGIGPGSLDAWSDYVHIGSEPPPWFCNGWSEYVVFDFAATEKHEPRQGRDTDVLKQVRLQSRGEGCL